MLEVITQLGTMGWTNILTIVVLLLVLFAEADKLIDGACKFLNRIGIQITTRHQRRDNAQEAKIQELEERIEQYQKHFDEVQLKRFDQSKHIRDDIKHDQIQISDNQKHLESIMDKISNSLSILDKRLLDEQIKRMRWRILDFSDSLANGNSASLEQFNNIIETHTEYEQVLHDNKMTNGLVSASYEFILQKYQELLHSHSEEE